MKALKTKTVETKVCRVCQEEKSPDLFEVDARVKNGTTNRCKACKSSLNDRAQVLLSNLKYRAAERGIPVEVTLKELRALYAAFDGRCAYCGISEDEKGARHHMDHVIPTSRGGTHHVSNLVLACADCNLTKRDKPFATFYIESDRSVFTETNFQTIEGFLSIMAGIPGKEYRDKILYEHAEYTTEKMFAEMDKQAEKEGIA